MRKWIAFLFCFAAYYSTAQIQTGITAGYNDADLYTHKALLTGNYTRKTSSINAFHIGVVTNIPINKKFVLQPEVLFNQKGTHKIEGGGFSGTFIHSTIRLNYFEVPVNILYHIYAHKNLKVFAGAGLYTAIGLWGKEKGSYSTFDSTGMPELGIINNKVDFTNSNTYKQNTTNVKPFDAGYNIIAGIEIKNTAVKVSYSYGFDKVYRNEYRNLAFAFSATCFFKHF